MIADQLGPVALTFDAEHPGQAHWSRDALPDVLTSLEIIGVVATFFLQGRWVQAEPDLARRIVSSGHEVGNHSHHHADLRLLHRAGIRDDTEAAGRAIFSETGIDPRPLYRAPYGTGVREPEVLAGLSAAGYRHVGWTLAPCDWVPGRTPERLRATIEKHIAPGAVLLLHSWTGLTAAALPGILHDLQERGARFMTVREHEAATGGVSANGK